MFAAGESVLGLAAIWPVGPAGTGGFMTSAVLACGLTGALIGAADAAGGAETFSPSSFVSATRADSANRSSSSGFHPSTSSASKVKLRTSLSLKPKGHEQNASRTPITRRRPHKHRNHRPRSQLAARLQIHSRICFSVIAGEDLRCAEASSGERGIAIDALS